MKAYLFLIICVVFSSKLVAQNEIYFSFLNSYNIINPAYTDFTPDAWFSLHSKHLNLKMEGAPHSSGIYYTSGSNSLQKIGWNFNTFRTKYGYRITGHTMAAINYKTKLNKTNFAFALQLGFSNNYFDYSTAGSTSNLSDPEFVNTSKRFRPNVGFGFFIKNPNYYIGYSAPIIFNYDNTHRTKASEFNSELQNTYHYFFGGADIKTGEKTYIRPVFSALMRKDYKSIYGFGHKFNILPNKISATLMYQTNRNILISTDFVNIAEIKNVLLSMGFQYTSIFLQQSTINRSVFEFSIKFRHNIKGRGMN